MTAFTDAQNTYNKLGVDVESALRILATTPISIPCWQGDDVTGFEARGETLGGGLAVSGNYPGKASTIDQLRQDVEMAMKTLPGKHRLNLHAMYGDFSGGKADRDEISKDHFTSWVNWAKQTGTLLDFNPTCFAHPAASGGLTLSSPDKGTRNFWIEHCRRSREIAAYFAQELKDTPVINIWIPDGSKDIPYDRQNARKRLIQSLDIIFSDAQDTIIDAVESKLFGIGSESFVVGSHEFYLGYASSRNKYLCLDAGHFHPTESIADKITAVASFVPGILLHLSRGIRWDSDHVVILDDQTEAVFQEIVKANLLDKVKIGLDFFDASVNRLAAWIIGTRASQKALLKALLLPHSALEEAESGNDFTSRLALFEAAKTLPFGAIWNEFCERENVPCDTDWIKEIKAYEKNVLAKRN